MCNELGVDPWIEVDGGVSPSNAGEVYCTLQFSHAHSFDRHLVLTYPSLGIQLTC